MVDAIEGLTKIDEHHHSREVMLFHLFDDSTQCKYLRRGGASWAKPALVTPQQWIYFGTNAVSNILLITLITREDRAIPR